MIYYNILDSLATLNEMFPVLVRCRRDARSFGEISARFFFFLNLGEISARCRQSSKISVRSYRDLERLKHHGEISARCRKSRRDLAEITNIMMRSVQYRRDLCNLGEISLISGRCRKSRRDSETRKHAGEISPISAVAGSCKVFLIDLIVHLFCCGISSFRIMLWLGEIISSLSLSMHPVFI